MSCKLRCNNCGATCWADGESEPDTNAFITTGIPKEWDGCTGNFNESALIWCEQEDFDVLDF